MLDTFESNPADLVTKVEYDAIAQEYRDIKSKLPLVKFVEIPSLLSLAGNVNGLKVLDLACGDGKYARLFKALGATEVVGVDLSSEMIKLAKNQSNNISYFVGDAAKLLDLKLGQFDLVAAAYLLNYASSVAVLKAMIYSIKLSLKPNGRFVTLNDNPFDHPNKYAMHHQYGYFKSMSSQTPTLGAPIKYVVKNDNEQVAFFNYYMPGDVIKREFEEAGFAFQFVKPCVSENDLPNAFWENVEANAPCVLMEAILKDKS